MVADDFSAEAVHALVDAALAAEDVKREGDASIPDPDNIPLPFTLLNMGLFADVAELVGQHCDEVTTVSMLDELRHRAMGHLDRGSAKALYGVVSRCRKCDTVEGTPCMPVHPRPSPDLLVVHELPMRDHLVEQRLVDLLSETGFASDRVMHTSVIRCDPAGVRGPNDTERANCAGYLFAEIQLCIPTLILCLGATAYQAFVGNDLRVTVERGNIFYLGPWALLPTYSLGYLFRRDRAIEEFRMDLETAHQYCYGQKGEA